MSWWLLKALQVKRVDGAAMLLRRGNWRMSDRGSVNLFGNHLALAAGQAGGFVSRVYQPGNQHPFLQRRT